MTPLRRLLTGLIALALMQFGVVATAPAHAHEADASHGVREIVLTHGHAHAESAHEAPALDYEQDGPHSDDDHHTLTDLTAQQSLPADGSDDPSHGEHAAHVHACGQFAPVGATELGHAPLSLITLVWPARISAATTHSTCPPLRPPRAAL